MNIIVVSEKLPKALTITLDWRHLVVASFMLLVFSGALNYGIVRFAAEFNIPFVREILVTIHRQQEEKNQSYMEDNLNAMAVRLGQMQAQLLRLDTLGERLAKLAGFKPQELMFNEAPGRGGPMMESSKPLSLNDFGHQIDLLTKRLEDRGDKLGMLDSLFTAESGQKKMIPNKLPVDGSWQSSSFGMRLDPFTGKLGMHEGIDFIAHVGSPIYAAAAGVVVYADFHHQYGNMVEIDHGNEIVTRYGHASKLLVKVGDVVLRGARIADVGQTGRATGPHLHFEVRQNGAARNPAQFLQAPG